MTPRPNPKAITAGVSEAWDFWLSQHPVTVGDLVQDAVKNAIRGWADSNGERLIATITEETSRRLAAEAAVSSRMETAAPTRPTSSPVGGNRPVPDAHEAQERRASEFFGLHPFFGLRLSTAHVCPLFVTGQHCHADTGQCVCLTHNRLFDHGRAWHDCHGNPVVTGEPYSATTEELTALATDVAALGLRVTLSGRSLWNPGYTLLIRITKEE